MNRCIDCHFLTKTTHFSTGGEFANSWSHRERSNFRISYHGTASCWKGIWDTGVDPSINDRLKDVLLEDRKYECFFIEYHEGMLFSAADELARIQRDNRQLKRNYSFTQIGLWIAAIAVCVQLIYNIFKDFVAK